MANNPLKKYIAEEVKAAVKQFERRGVLNDPGYEVTVSDISPLETQIRVKAPVGGTRYFTVKISEHW